VGLGLKIVQSLVTQNRITLGTQIRPVTSDSEICVNPSAVLTLLVGDELD